MILFIWLIFGLFKLWGGYWEQFDVRNVTLRTVQSMDFRLETSTLTSVGQKEMFLNEISNRVVLLPHRQHCIAKGNMCESGI